MKKQMAMAMLWLCGAGTLQAAAPSECSPALNTVDLVAPAPAVSNDAIKQAKEKAATASAESLKNYFSQVSGSWPPRNAAGTVDEPKVLKCASELKEAFQKAGVPEVARLGGTDLLNTANRLREQVGAGPETVGTIAVQEIAKLGTGLVAAEQRKDSTAARYDFYAGPVYSLSPDGSWDNGLEILFRSNTDKFGEGKLLMDYFQVSSLFAYRTSAGEKVNLDPEAGEGEEPGEEEPGTGFVSPFDADGGTASIDLRLAGFISEAAGFAALAGAESLPTDSDDSGLTTLKARGGLGGLYRTNYADGALGELFVGYIHDSRFKARFTGEDEDSTERIALSGILQLPAFDKSDSLRLAARIFASTPITGGNSSELRISVLIAYDLRTVFSKF